ncbi:MAG: cohesin domain-containing protein [bacterium]
MSDLMSTKRRCSVNSSGVFIEASTNLPQIFESSIAWADTDNDNDLDLVISGYRGPDSEANLYLNDSPPNTPPSKPTTLSFSYTKPILNLFWNSGTDIKTPSSGLYYNIRIGTSSGSLNIVSPLHSSGQFGSYYGLQNRNFKITNLPSGRYYWAVQAIDTTLSKSAWSAEQEVIISSVNPKITFLSPLSGMVGDAVTIKAESFLSDEDIAIHFGTYQTVTTTRTNLNGTFSITFVVSTSLSGTHTITASSRIGFATTQFLIIPGPLERIQIIPQSIVLVPAQTQTFTAQGFDRWGNLLNLSYNWSLSSPIGTLSLILGLSTVFFAGTSSDSAILTASAGTISGTATISISKTSLYLSPESIVTGSSYTTTLSVNLKDVENLVGADIFLSFNPQKLEVLNIAQGGFPEGVSVLINQVDAGTIAYSFILLGSETSGSGQIATITLRAKEDGTSAIDFIFRPDQNRNTNLLGKNGQSIPCLYNQSFITIYSYATLTGMIKIDIPHINGHSGGLLILNSQETRTTTNANGRFLFSEVLPGTHTLRLNMPGASMATYTLSLLPGETKDMGTSTLLNGDSDGNGGVNISDFYFLRTGYLKDGFVIFWYNSSDLSRDGFINADFNGDNMTNIDDAYILRENFGKVADAGFRGRARKGFRQSSDSQLSIVPSIISAQPSREFVCQVVATNIKELVACELHLNFDPNLFSVKEIVEGELLKGGFPLVKGYDNQKGRRSYAKGLFQGTASGSGVVATIIFEA